MRHADLSPRLAIVMVGLPARGKTWIARKIANYLRWLGLNAAVFNVGNYRRQHIGAELPHDFFDPQNPEGRAARRRMALAALDDLIAWLDDGGHVAIYDATNSTHDRRELVRSALERAAVQVLFVESVCDDPEVIDRNVRQTKLRSPDYAHVDEATALADFRRRIAHYEAAYEPLADPSASFIKLVDVGRQLVINRIDGYLPGRLVTLLMNLHVAPRRIWLTRHGESAFNAEGRLGGDAPLSARGQVYARSLADFVSAEAKPPLRVLTSRLQRTRLTAAPRPYPTEAWAALDEIDAGVCDGLTPEEIAQRWPEEASARRADKLGYRYPRGESYEDLIDRVEPVILELERTRGDVLVVGHQAVLRVLYGYLAGLDRADCPHLPMPLHTVIELVPEAYGATERRLPLAPGPPAPPPSRRPDDGHPVG
jgi:broad specificity phosphatase PhoE/predicted kinase